jgi:hypothetical protein
MRIPIVIRNIIALSVLSLLESIHLLIPVVLVVNYVSPLKYDPLVWNKYFPFLQSAIRPEREIFFYHCWLVFAVAIHAVLVWFFRKDLQDGALLRRIRAYILNEAVFLFALLFCIFKILLWNYPAWGWVLLYAVLILSWGVRIFWPEACKGTTRAYSFVDQLASGKWCDILMIAGIFMLIFPTDIESILARVFIQERFHHFDGVIMAPGWAFLSGSALNVDVICQYGIGMTAAVTKLAQSIGGFSYQNVLWVYIYATCFYFIAAFLLLRFWLGSFLLAAAGILLSIKFQMFHWGVAPIIWEFLSVTVVRYFLDMFFLFFILHHIRHRSWGLWAACICSGISLAYMSDTGVYQWVALCVYLLILGWEQRKIFLAVYAIVPFFLSVVILWMIEGPALWSAAFWQGAMEQGNLFLNGLGDLPIYQNLSDGNFFAFFMGLFIPVVYVFSLILTGAQYALDRSRRENVFVVILCIYGLGLYHYFICRSAVSSYHAVDIPFVFVLCYWAREILSRTSARMRRGISLMIFSLTLGALLTNYFFTYYPNVLNIARNDFSKEKEFYRQQFNFEDDALLIKNLTSPQEKVALISSSEVKILMTANRKPFFYYFPLIYPNFMNTNAFSGTYLYTSDRVKRTLDQLQTASPRYVFVEAIFYRGQLSADIYQKNAGLTILMNYLHTYYDESAQGKYLLALKRKGTL